MGCDIHLVLEQRNPIDGRWIGVNTFANNHLVHRTRETDWGQPAARSRNYDRFAELAGVRGPGPEPRGIPDNASETSRFLIAEWGADGHSHSWLPLVEAANIWARTEYWRDWEEEDSFARKFPASFFFDVDTQDFSAYRVVFWFDN